MNNNLSSCKIPTPYLSQIHQRIQIKTIHTNILIGFILTSGFFHTYMETYLTGHSFSNSTKKNVLLHYTICNCVREFLLLYVGSYVLLFLYFVYIDIIIIVHDPSAGISLVYVHVYVP